MADKRLLMPTNLCQFRMNWLMPDGDIANNILYMAKTDCVILGESPVPFTDANASAQAHNLAAAWNSSVMIGNQGTDITLQSIDWAYNTVQGVGPLREGTETAAPMPLTGTGGSIAQANGITIALREQTGYGGRSNHGRLFLVGPAQGMADTSDPNLIKAASATALTTRQAAFLAAWPNNDCVAGVGDDFHWVIVSFTENGATRPVASYKTITAFNRKDDFFDYQRRRAPAHARHH